MRKLLLDSSLTDGFKTDSRLSDRVPSRPLKQWVELRLKIPRDREREVGEKDYIIKLEFPIKFRGWHVSGRKSLILTTG